MNVREHIANVSIMSILVDRLWLVYQEGSKDVRKSWISAKRIIGWILSGTGSFRYDPEMGKHHMCSLH